MGSTAGRELKWMKWKMVSWIINSARRRPDSRRRRTMLVTFKALQISFGYLRTEHFLYTIKLRRNITAESLGSDVRVCRIPLVVLGHPFLVSKPHA